jgi:hypothetical protein
VKQCGHVHVLKKWEEKPPSKVNIKKEKKFGIYNAHVIICKNCGHVITLPECIISVNGEHVHAFTNPGGFSYEIGCFSTAEGCVVYGDPTPEHTWFSGFRWSFSICSNCLVHLGWYYEREDESFFGLILDLLVDTARSH